jgi:hypothetical protein
MMNECDQLLAIFYSTIQSTRKNQKWIQWWWFMYQITCIMYQLLATSKWYIIHLTCIHVIWYLKKSP